METVGCKGVETNSYNPTLPNGKPGPTVATQADALRERSITRCSLETRALIDAKDLKGHCARELRTRAERRVWERGPRSWLPVVVGIEKFLGGTPRSLVTLALKQIGKLE